jgi:hypothetical protein
VIPRVLLLIPLHLWYKEKEYRYYIVNYSWNGAILTSKVDSNNFLFEFRFWGHQLLPVLYIHSIQIRMWCLLLQCSGSAFDWSPGSWSSKKKE